MRRFIDLDVRCPRMRKHVEIKVFVFICIVKYYSSKSTVCMTEYDSDMKREAKRRMFL